MLWPFVLTVLFISAFAIAHARAFEVSAAEYRAGEMDASSADHYCPPGRVRSMVASGHCWHSGEYGYENEWRRGKAKANGDCLG
jgi:hypothetical protein